MTNSPWEPLNEDFETPEPEFTQEEIDRHLIMQIISDNTDLPYRNTMELAGLIVEGLKGETDD